MKLDKISKTLAKHTNINTDHNVCFFRIAHFEDKSCAYEALEQGSIVFLDLSIMDIQELQRMKDYMQGVCIPLKCHIRDICEDYVAYFPSDYHLQIFEN